MKKMQIIQYILLLTINLTSLIQARSIRRPADLTIPIITVRPSDPIVANSWKLKPQKRNNKKEKITHKKIHQPRKKKISIHNEYALTSPYLRINPIKQAFDQAFFEKHYLPDNQILEYRNKSGSVSTTILNNLAEDVVAEIKAGNQTFSHFKTLKDKDFNYKKLSGLLVLKYKDYPFVLKLAIEHPHTMIDPYSKSIESKFIFILGGNIRHLSNFTRILNLENIKKILMFNPYYLENVDFPRKWYWKPKDNYNLEITWQPSPYKSEEKFSIPSIYAVICDYVDVDPTFPQQELNKIAMKIATDTEFLIDPHAGNTVIEKGSTKYTLIDTENFRIMTGLDHTLNAKKYSSWFIEMSTGCLKIYGGRTKKERIKHCFSYLE